MNGSVEVHVIRRFKLQDLTADSEEELIGKALSEDTLLRFLGTTARKGDIIRYIVTTQEHNLLGTLYHDRDFLDTLHEERLDEALVFDTDEYIVLRSI